VNPLPTAGDIAGFLDQLAPSALAEDWDNTGLLVGRRESVVTDVLTCLTLTPDVATEAIKKGVSLIVTHHPVMFRAVRQLTGDTVEGRMLLALIEAKIAVYSPHTSFDSALQGINQQLAEAFGLLDVRPIRPDAMDEAIGAGRWGHLPEEVSLPVFLATVRSGCSARYLEYSGMNRSTVKTVAVACGAAGEFLDDARQLGCDTFVTGEGRFHSALEARNNGVTLIFTGHYSSERPAVEWLANRIGSEFSEVTSVASVEERDPLELYTDE